jgi:hypothetical protein
MPSQGSSLIRIWVSYPWTCSEDLDFRHIVARLSDSNIEATYDSLEIEPNTTLPARIMHRLANTVYDGWVCILTHHLLARRTASDDLIGAIDQILSRLGPDFPMIALLHNVAAHEVPAMLRVRPCLSLGDPDWRHRLLQRFQNREHPGERTPAREDTRFVWKIHSCFGGDPSLTAIEVSSRQECIQYWRFAIPRSTRNCRWGTGPAGGGDISPIKFSVTRGYGRHGNEDVAWFGAANAVSATESAYVVFSGSPPEFIFFGPARTPTGPPGPMEMFRANRATKLPPGSNPDIRTKTIGEFRSDAFQTATACNA